MTIANLMRGKHAANPSDDVLTAFADVFKIPLPRLRELAGRPAGEPEPYTPPPEADLLDARQRRAVDEIIRSMVSATGALPPYLVGVLDSLTPGETAQFLRDLEGTTRERLDTLWRQRKRWLDDGGLPTWDPTAPVDMPAYRESAAAYEEYIFALTPDSKKGLPVEQWHKPERVEPDLSAVLAASGGYQEGENTQKLATAARKGNSHLRDARRRQDQASQAPDPEGPEEGA